MGFFSFYDLKTYLKVLGHASDDMKIDSVMSSRTWSKNSALAQASVADSILLGFNSQDWRDSIILQVVKEKYQLRFKNY